MVSINRAREHRRDHGKCPNEDCDWAEATTTKQLDRHVAVHHRNWASQTDYEGVGGYCPDCNGWFERADQIPRHQREYHLGERRVRREGG
jgi:hypothetical protein